MVDIYLIRHAESTANAGFVTTDPGAIPLSAKGHAQAAALALTFTETPALIVMSPYIRTQQTAAPTLEKFKDTPRQIWPIHEFTYISPDKCRATTAEERRVQTAVFWQKADPAYIDGDGAESFSQMILRLRDMVTRLEQATEGPILVFTHGQFIQALRQLLAEPASSDETRMKAFRAFESTDPVHNTSVLRLTIRNGRLAAAAPMTGAKRPPSPKM